MAWVSIKGGRIEEVGKRVAEKRPATSGEKADKKVIWYFLHSKMSEPTH
jgi:hypothetical protein